MLWFVLAAASFSPAVGAECLRIGPRGVEYWAGWFLRVRHRRVPLSEIKGIAPNTSPTPRERRRSEPCLKLVTLGRPLRLGRNLDAEEVSWLLERIHRHVRRLGHDCVAPLKEDDLLWVEWLSPGRTVAERPHDCQIEMCSSWDRTEFVRKGAFPRDRLCALAFWTVMGWGTIAFCLLNFFKTFHPNLLVLSIVFAAMCLSPLAGWWAALSAPFRINRWTVRRDEFAVGFSIFGLGLTRQLDVTQFGGIKVQRNSPPKKWWALNDVGEDETPYALWIIGRDHENLLTINDLTEGEARWLGGQFCTLLKGAFAEDPAIWIMPDHELDPLWDREVDP